MKVSVTIIALLFAGQVCAKWNSCGFGDYQTVFKALAQGVGTDITKVDTDCVTSGEKLGKKFKQLGDNFASFTVQNWAQPLYTASEISTTFISVFTACQTTNLAKQFAIRFNSLSGFFDLMSTVGVSFLMEYVTKPGKSPLYSAFSKVASETTCEQTALYFGKSVALLFSYEALPKVYSNQLPQDLVNGIKK